MRLAERVARMGQAEVAARVGAHKAQTRVQFAWFRGPGLADGGSEVSLAEETTLAHRMMERIFDSVVGDGASEIVFSYAEQSAESMQRPSSLVSNFAPLTIQRAARQHEAVELESVGE